MKAHIACMTHPMTQFRIGKKTFYPVDHSRNISRLHQEPVLPFHYHILKRPHRCRYDRKSCTQCFQSH